MSVCRRQNGLTLVEVLVTAVLLSILLVPAITALHTAIIGADTHSDVSASHFQLRTRLEEMLAEPFTDLASAAGTPTTPSSYSDPAGPPGRLIVYLSFYDGDDADADGDPFTGTDPDILWISVEIESTVYSLQTVRARGY